MIFVIPFFAFLLSGLASITAFQPKHSWSVKYQEKRCSEIFQPNARMQRASVLSSTTTDKTDVFNSLRPITQSNWYGFVEASTVFALLTCIDGGFSGDWTKFNLIDKDFEKVLQTIAIIAGILHIILAGIAGQIIAKRESSAQPVLPAILHTLLIGFLGFIKVYNQTDTTAVRFYSFNDLKKSLVKLFAGEYNAQEINAQINKDLQENPIVMYSFTTCPYCIKAKEILIKKYQAKVKVIELNEDKSRGNAIRTELGQRTGRTSVPSIWILGQFIGGCNDGPTEIVFPGSGKVIKTKGGVANLDKEQQLQALLTLA